MRKRTIRQNVEAILTMNEEARADDKILLVEYWRHIDGIDFTNFENEFLRKGTVAESIRRQRQLIQEDGFFLPSEQVLEELALRKMEMRESTRKNRRAS